MPPSSAVRSAVPPPPSPLPLDGYQVWLTANNRTDPSKPYIRFRAVRPDGAVLDLSDVDLMRLGYLVEIAPGYVRYGRGIRSMRFAVFQPPDKAADPMSVVDGGLPFGMLDKTAADVPKTPF